jgi:inorganic pyrophosphatase
VQVPLYPFENDTTIINAVVEIPRWTDGKIEIESEEPLTPIFHDDRKGAPRFVESVWYVNEGYIPISRSMCRLCTSLSAVGRAVLTSKLDRELM